MEKNRCIEYADKTFVGRAKELVLHQIEMFYDNTQIEHNAYKLGDKVFLKKHTFMHGVSGDLESLDWVLENGFVAKDFSEPTTKNKIKNSIGMWNLRCDCYLSDYVNLYSGGTILFWQRCELEKDRYVMAPYGCIDKVLEQNKNEDYWGWSIEQNKEVSFMPSLARDVNQLAFILNMDSAYAKKMAEADVFSYDMDAETLRPFLDERYYPKFIAMTERTPLTTDREAAIMFGLPSKLIEGVLVGRRFEHDEKKLMYIKSHLADCYICNLDGVVIM